MTYLLIALGGAAALAALYLAGRWAKKFFNTYLFFFCNAIVDSRIKQYHAERIGVGLDPAPNGGKKAPKQPQDTKKAQPVKYPMGQTWGQTRGFMCDLEKATPEEIAEGTLDPITSEYGEKEQIH